MGLNRVINETNDPSLTCWIKEDWVAHGTEQTENDSLINMDMLGNY